MVYAHTLCLQLRERSTMRATIVSSQSAHRVTPQTVSLRYRLFLKLQNAKNKTVAFPSAFQVLSTTKHRFGNVDLVLVSISHRPFLKTCILPLGTYTSRKLSTSSRRPLRNRELVNNVFLKYPPSFVLHYFSMFLFPFTVSKEV